MKDPAEPTEAQFTKQVIDLARLHGWRVAHFRPGLTRSGKWVTPVQGDGKGFPDLVLVRSGVILFVELKVGRNKATDEQVAWLDALRETGAAAGVWRPEQWDDIVRTLTAEPGAAA